MGLSLSIKDKILYDLDLKNAQGIEIGPLANPLVSKDESNVCYVDRASTEEIIEWYKKSDVPLEKIVQVDHVWGDESLSAATGSEGTLDYCVAAHVIEHVPDLIGWLQEISSILKDGGIASFSIPDKRYTFDYFRPETITADLLDAYFRKLRKPSVRHIFDHFSSFTEIDVVEAWTPGFNGSELERVNSLQKVYNTCLEAVENNSYIDSHCWVFTASNFIHLLQELCHLDLLDFKLRRFFAVEHNTFEFVVQLEKIPTSRSSADKHVLFNESMKRIHPHVLRIQFESSQSGEAQVYFDIGNGFNEQDSVRQQYTVDNKNTLELEFTIPPVSIHALRFDPAMSPVNIKIEQIDLMLFGEEPVAVPLESFKPGKNIRSSGFRDGFFYAKSRLFSKDPFIQIKLSASTERMT